MCKSFSQRPISKKGSKSKDTEGERAKKRQRRGKERHVVTILSILSCWEDGDCEEVTGSIGLEGEDYDVGLREFGA